MVTKPPPREFTRQDVEFMSTLNEYQKRTYLGTQAIACGRFGVCKVTKFFGTDRKTVYTAIKEIERGYRPSDGKVRRPGGGRKKELDKHPEWVDTFNMVAAPYKAGLPQDETVFWVSIGVPTITRLMRNQGCEVTEYLVRQLLESLGYKRRSFIKSLPMREVQSRDEQFNIIRETKEQCMRIGLPVISIDTKKKEFVGNFKRPGSVMCQAAPFSFDHDFATFAEARIVPHGIYDIARNVGYMTIGTSHDTSSFVCDNIERVWNDHLHDRYPDAGTIVVLCDGGGSNSCSHRIVKQDLMNLANRLDMNILVMHYPPYCSKFNPIEHRLFSQVTRSWSGAPLMSVGDAANRAAMTTTSKGLTVYVDVVDKTYENQRKLNSDYDYRLKNQIVFRKCLPKWNYLVKPL